MTNLTSPKLEDVFRSVFNLSSNADVTMLAQEDVPEWDSLAHVSLILALESEFGVQIDSVDSLDITSFDAAARYLTEHGL